MRSPSTRLSEHGQYACSSTSAITIAFKSAHGVCKKRWAFPQLRFAWPALLVMLLSVIQVSYAQTDFIGSSFRLPSHPRILLAKDEENRIKKTVNSDKIWQNLHAAIITECKRLTDVPPVERIQIGR